MTDSVTPDTRDAPAAPTSAPAEAQTSPASFEDLGPSAAGGAVASLDTLLDISVDVSIRFGRARLTVQEILELGPGSVVQLDRMVGEPIDVYVSDRKFGEGEVVVIGEHFGIRLTKTGLAGAAGS